VEDLVGASDGKGSSDGVVQSIGLHSKWSVRDPVGKDRSGGEGLLQEVKGGATILTKIPRNVFAGKPCERYDDVSVKINHKGALLCPVSETKLRGELQVTDLVPSVRD